MISKGIDQAISIAPLLEAADVDSASCAVVTTVAIDDVDCNPFVAMSDVQRSTLTTTTTTTKTVLPTTLTKTSSLSSSSSSSSSHKERIERLQKRYAYVLHHAPVVLGSAASLAIANNVRQRCLSSTAIEQQQQLSSQLMHQVLEALGNVEPRERALLAPNVASLHVRASAAMLVARQCAELWPRVAAVQIERVVTLIASLDLADVTVEATLLFARSAAQCNEPAPAESALHVVLANVNAAIVAVDRIDELLDILRSQARMASLVDAIAHRNDIIIKATSIAKALRRARTDGGSCDLLRQCEQAICDLPFLQTGL